ncbi:Protein CROWDED NUCLEI 4 [Hibiscus syriacus]|uniref:Protein CROWDED NUCLEI 4 n=1 Tax=Hibiscus syriacus TaxID=106335 RepID=A0A6A2XJD7_HIBSY|nr:Protein CROWDED NUCLEI 4 [Hibiscus syriacus]
MTSPITPGSTRALSITPGSRVVKSPLSDETIWKRLKEAGFDEESIKKRDKAALIAYIAKLEAELFEHQHHMGLLILERKEVASNRLAEARIMIEDAQKKLEEAETKFRAAKSLQTETSIFQRTAERKLQEVEAHEEDLSRRIVQFKNDCDTKEEIIRERQLLSERQKIVQQEHERLLHEQATLNHREEYICSRTRELSQLEKELKTVTEHEALLINKEQQLLVSRKKLANKESDEIRKVVSNHETSLRAKKSQFEAELEIKRKMAEDETEMKRRACELKEMDIKQSEDLICEREHDFDVRSRILAEKERDVFEKSNLIDEREKITSAFEKELELKKVFLEKEREEISEMKLELQKSLSSLEDKRNKVDCAKEKLQAMRSETHELSNLELKLKEELDLIRDQKLELMANADRLQVEKAKFETEWELIDEKREELRKEAVCVQEEREAILKFLKDERDSLRRESDAMREKHKKDVESLNREREDFMQKMLTEHSDWFNKIQQERAELLLGIETQKRELENCTDKRREEMDSSLKEREEDFEQEKKIQFQLINALKERAGKELEQATLEMKRLDAERMEIKLDCDRREREWAELNKSIEELKVQRHKLKQQRELLHADRNEIHAEIEELKRLGDLKAAVDNMMVAQMQCSIVSIAGRKHLKERL